MKVILHISQLIIPKKLAESSAIIMSSSLYNTELYGRLVAYVAVKNIYIMFID